MKMLSFAILSLCVTSALGQEIIIENEPESGHGYRMGSDYTLHCQGSLGSGCSIQWLRDLRIMGYTSDRIQVTAEPGNVRYICRFRCNNGEDVTQSDVKILSGQNLVRVEVLNSGVPGIDWRPRENSTMEFTCGFEMLSSQITKGIEEEIRPAFQWIVNGGVMDTEQRFTFVAVPGYNKDIQCKAMYNDEELTSATVSVIARAEAEKPEVVFMQQNTVVEQNRFITGVGYTAYCVSKSHSAGAIYGWTKDYFDIPDTPASRTFVLDSANGDSDDGVYRCRMRLQEDDYCSRSSVVMEVEAAGRFCQSGTDCLAGDEYTRMCKSHRCECASGYAPRGDVCAGITPLVASVFLVVCALILTRLL